MYITIPFIDMPCYLATSKKPGLAKIEVGTLWSLVFPRERVLVFFVYITDIAASLSFTEKERGPSYPLRQAQGINDYNPYSPMKVICLGKIKSTHGLVQHLPLNSEERDQS